MNILLVNLPWQKEGKWGVRAGSRWPHIKDENEGDYLPFPFFLTYATSLLQKHRVPATLIDAIVEQIPEDRFIEKISRMNFDLLVAETSTPSFLNDLNILKKLSSLGMRIVLCGPHIEIYQPKFLKEHTFIDFVLYGEYEFTLLELVRNLEENNKLSRNNGLIWRDKNGVIKNPKRQPFDINLLPWPHRETLPMNKYIDAPCDMALPSVQLVASRGCPFGCNFCLWPQVLYQGNHYRTRDIKDVVNEMEYLVRNKKFKSIYFDDDTFNIGKGRLLQFCQEIKGRKLQNTPWAIMARPDLMDEEILEEMKSAGLFAVKYGVESGVQEIQELSGKYINLNKAADAIHITKKLGIKVHLTFMFGLPGETKKTIKQTIDFALGLNPDSIQFSIVTPFPGTKYFEDLDKIGFLLSKRCSDYDGNSISVLRTEEMTAEELESAKKEVYLTWSQYCKKRKVHGHQTLIYKFIFSLKTFGPRYTLRKMHRYINRTLRDYQLSQMSNKSERSKLLAIKGILHSYRAFVGPEVLHIDLTNQCNFNCIVCWDRSPLLDEKAKLKLEKKPTLPLKLLKSVFDDLANMGGLQQVKLVGGGEPLMHPNILEIIEYIKSKDKNIEVNLHTNGSLLTEKIIDKLFQLNVDFLTISLWTGTPEIYSIVHPNQDESTFYKISNILKFIHEQKKVMNKCSPRIRIHNVIFKLNYKDIEQMIKYALEVGAENVHFVPMDPIGGKTDTLILNDNEKKELLEKLYIIKNHCHLGTSRYISKDYKSLVLCDFDIFIRRIENLDTTTGAYDEKMVEGIPCYIGWLFVRIMATGDVVPCLKSHRMPLGNIYKDRFKHIWFSDTYDKFRYNALTLSKINPYFSRIGHGAVTRMGCYNCDNFWHNITMHRKISQLKNKSYC